MKRTVYRRILLVLILCNVTALVAYGYHLLKTSVPDELKILLGQEEEFELSMPIHASISEDAVGVLYVNEEPLSEDDITIDLSKPVSVSSNELGTYDVKLSLFGILPLKEISLEVIEKIEVIPGGNVIGLQVETDGILVLGAGSVMGRDGAYHEPAAGILKSGDYIMEVNGEKVNGKEDLMKRIGKETLQLTVERDGKRRNVSVLPVKDSAGDYKIGVWIRTDTQGIGTLTFTTTTGYFGALGHGITDIDTGVLMKVGKGSVYEAEVLNIVRGKEGTPGELVGIIRRSENCCLGSITKNTPQGIFGETQLGKTATSGVMSVGLKQKSNRGQQRFSARLIPRSKSMKLKY